MEDNRYEIEDEISRFISKVRKKEKSFHYVGDDEAVVIEQRRVHEEDIDIVRVLFEQKQLIGKESKKEMV